MKRNETAKKYIKVTGIANYINWFREITKHIFIVTAEGNFYLINGERIPAQQFEQSLPTVELQINKFPKGDLLDGRVIV